MQSLIHFFLSVFQRARRTALYYKLEKMSKIYVFFFFQNNNMITNFFAMIFAGDIIVQY